MTISVIATNDVREVKIETFNARTQNWETSYHSIESVGADEDCTNEEVIELAQEWINETAA